MAAKLIDLVGRRYGKLTVVAHSGVHTYSNGRKVHIWDCKCDCGNTKRADAGNLKSGNVRSCGCLFQPSVISTKHGMSRSTEFYIWSGILARCYNQNSAAYHRYGGRGIQVCDEWKESFEAFYKDMGDRPSNNHSVDRIDNDGDYSPENCRWATRQEQGRNTSSNRWFTYNGKRMILADWAKEVGMPLARLHTRLKRGWTFEDAITIPLNGKRGKKGVDNSNAKLDYWTVMWIKRLLSVGNKGRYIAHIFGISEGLVSSIKCGNSWKEVTI